MEWQRIVGLLRLLVDPELEQRAISLDLLHISAEFLTVVQLSNRINDSDLLRLDQAHSLLLLGRGSRPDHGLFANQFLTILEHLLLLDKLLLSRKGRCAVQFRKFRHILLRTHAD